jgi:uncharacterized protein YdcH (DUF465 family)
MAIPGFDSLGGPRATRPTQTMDDEERTDDPPSPSELEARFDSFIQWVDGLEDRVEHAETQNQELRDELSRMKDDHRQLRARIQELQQATSLLEKAKQAELSSPEERAVACIQNLKNKADRRNANRVAINAEEGLSAVNHSIDRTSIYDVFRKAEDILGRPDVLWYESEPRSSEKDSRLILDRRSEDLPGSVAGHSLTEARGRSTTPDMGDGAAQTPKQHDSATSD